MLSNRFLVPKAQILLFLFSTLLISPLSAAESCPTDFSELYEKKPWKIVVRSKALRSLDKMLGWTMDKNKSSYISVSPPKEKVYRNSSKALFEYAKSFNYFSQEHPLVSQVTRSQEDVLLTTCLLKSLDEIENSEERHLAVSEVIVKVLAYRDLLQGQEFDIPTQDEKGRPTMTKYIVDSVFDLWKGMPAFGLLPIEGDGAPILLFRGTDLSLITKRGWASVLSDMDVKGPGLKVFQNNRSILERWLKKATQEKKARVMGFSLGGVLGIYTLIFEHEFLTRNIWEPSIVFEPPGVSGELFDLWEKIPDKQKIPFFIFVTQGDVIPKIGKLVGRVRELSCEVPLQPISAHVTILTAEPIYRLNFIDLNKENLNRFKNNQ